jgi:histidinol-phosphate aminotransferase
VGYALASPAIADALARVRPIFNVNGPAQAAAVASLAAREAVAARVADTRRVRRKLHDGMAAAGLDPVPSQTNFVYADVPGGNGASLADRLLRAGFIVRALGGFGAPGAIRVTCGTDEEIALFLAALPTAAADAGGARQGP